MGNIDGRWEDLTTGDIPQVASDVWHHMDRTASVHQLAADLHIPLRECVFWLCVFKRHLGVWVDLDAGRYQFKRSDEEPDLTLAIRHRTREMPDAELSTEVRRSPPYKPL